MDIETLFIIGVAVGTNIIVVKMKIDRARYSDALLDGVVLVLLSILFKGTVSGLTIATVASALFSTYLWFSPPKLDLSRWIKDFKK